MDLTDDHDHATLRAELRGWLAEPAVRELLRAAAVEPADVAERFAMRQRWHRLLDDGGWIGMSWPADYGGRGLPPTAELVLTQELVAAAAPPIGAWVAVELVAPVLLRFGSAAQRATLLPAIRRGDLVACQGFSEVDAGSDLAAVRTTAVPDGDGWRLTGVKMWTSWAQFSQVALVLARTGAEDSRHRGLSCFLVPLDTPGVRVGPLRMLHGGDEENWLTLAEARVPGDAVLGAIDGGWPVVMHSLNLARGLSSITRTAQLAVTIDRLTARLVDTALPAGLVERLGRLHARVRALRFLTYRVIGELDEHGSPGPVGSTEKLLWSGISAELARFALDAGGPDALVEDTAEAGTSSGERFEYLRALGNSVEGGADEVQRDILARRVLGMGA